MIKPEILAPAGGEEQLIAAVRSGADAVYLGTKNFNARRNAENFDDLRKTVAFCRARDVKVHVAVNTLVNDGELPEVVNTARNIAQSGADAVIVQDLAAARIFRECVPEIALHASTQLTVHNLAGAKELEKLGFSRVVLSRELSLDEIKRICDGTDLEVEVFVHGALCMCMSGACYLSSVIGGRSGNRGLCAQPCRLDFRIAEKHYALSLKDMCHIEYIDDLLNAGVCSFKIEGRMKRPEYVAAAVNACRDAVSGRRPDIDTLRAVFSRSGFTDGYISGKRTAEMFGHRTREDVASATAVLGKLSALYRSERRSVPVEMSLSFGNEKQSILTANDGQNSVTVYGAVPESARTRPLDLKTAEKQLGKTGGTPFYLNGLVFKADPELNLPLPELNRMRREALEKLLSLREVPRPLNFINNDFPGGSVHFPNPVPELFVRAQTFDQAKAVLGAKRYILPIEEILAHPHSTELFGDSLYAELPRLIFDDEKAAFMLEQAKKAGVRSVCAENIGALHMAKELGLNVCGGHGLNILNTLSLCEYERLGLEDATVSFELSAERIKRLGGKIKRGIIGYGRLPLMQMRACPAKGENGCGKCVGITAVRDRKGMEFTLMCHERQYGTLLNCVELSLSDKTVVGIDFMTLYFTTESPEECRKVINAYKEKRVLPGRRTGGLYYREIL